MEPLTREQVANRFLILRASTTNQLYDCTKALELHEATQYAQLAAMTQERDVKQGTNELLVAAINRSEQEIERLRKEFECIHYIDQTALLEAINTGDVLRMLEKSTALFNQCRDIAQRALAGTKEGT